MCITMKVCILNSHLTYYVQFSNELNNKSTRTKHFTAKLKSP